MLEVFFNNKTATLVVTFFCNKILIFFSFSSSLELFCRVRKGPLADAAPEKKTCSNKVTLDQWQASQASVENPKSSHQNIGRITAFSSPLNSHPLWSHTHKHMCLSVALTAWVCVCVCSSECTQPGTSAVVTSPPFRGEWRLLLFVHLCTPSLMWLCSEKVVAKLECVYSTFLFF